MLWLYKTSESLPRTHFIGLLNLPTQKDELCNQFRFSHFGWGEGGGLVYTRNTMCRNIVRTLTVCFFKTNTSVK